MTQTVTWPTYFPSYEDEANFLAPRVEHNISIDDNDVIKISDREGPPMAIDRSQPIRVQPADGDSASPDVWMLPLTSGWTFVSAADALLYAFVLKMPIETKHGVLNVTDTPHEGTIDPVVAALLARVDKLDEELNGLSNEHERVMAGNEVNGRLRGMKEELEKLKNQRGLRGVATVKDRLQAVALRVLIEIYDFSEDEAKALLNEQAAPAKPAGDVQPTEGEKPFAERYITYPAPREMGIHRRDGHDADVSDSDGTRGWAQGKHEEYHENAKVSGWTTPNAHTHERPESSAPS